jgi:glycosyltransferase involved in cell wall biosynthesis
MGINFRFLKSFFTVKKDILVMTLLVRDEIDIIEKNILFHLNSGVDKIVAIDNGSVDGTRDILEKYKKKGVLDYWVINKHTYEQDKWVSSMAKYAKNILHASYIMHCDADEFWYSKCGLKRELENMHDVLFVPVKNILPPSLGHINNSFFDRFKYEVVKTKLIEGVVKDRVSSKLLFYDYPKKIITRSKFTKIGYGNDSVYSKKKMVTSISKNICIYHFPIRSFEHFKQKVINGGSSYLNNPNKNPSIGWHWKAWYKIFLKGNLRNEYIKIALENDVCKKYLKTGIIKMAKFPKLFYKIS